MKHSRSASRKSSHKASRKVASRKSSHKASRKVASRKSSHKASRKVASRKVASRKASRSKKTSGCGAGSKRKRIGSYKRAGKVVKGHFRCVSAQ
jgi:hypothetical protein